MSPDPSTGTLHAKPAAGVAGRGLQGPLGYWPAALTALIGLTLCLALGAARQAQRVASEQVRIQQELSAVRMRVEAVARATFVPTLGLGAMIQLDGGISDERFNALSQRVVHLLPQIRSIVAAPNDIARHVYPLKGNEAVLDLDYRHVPVQLAQIQLARRLGRALLVGPVKLVQGGEGIIQRTPVFLPAQQDLPPSYWGVISVVADLPGLMQAAGLSGEPTLRLAIFQWQEDEKRPGPLVWGDASLAGQPQAVAELVQMPGATWVIKALPIKADGLQARWLDAELLSGLLASAALTLLAGLLVQRRRHLLARNLALARQIELGRQNQAALTQAKDRLQAVLDSACEVAIIVTDMEGQIRLFNRGAERMLGYAEAQLLDRCITLLHREEELLARGAQIVHEGGRTLLRVDAASLQSYDTETSDWTFVRRDGSPLEVSLTVSLMREADGALIGWLCIARDITTQRQAQRALVTLNAELESRVEKRSAELQQTLASLNHAQADLLRAEKMAALGSLVAGIAHELNTPLGNCLTTASTLESMTQAIRREFEAGAMRRSVLASYLNNAQTASSILLRSMASATELVIHFKQVSVDQSTAQRRLFTLAAVVEDVLSLLNAQLRKAGIQVHKQAAATPQLDAYPGPLGQVLSNLIMNALLHAFAAESMADPPCLTIRSEQSDSDRAKGEIVLIVEDNGCGMSEEVRRRAFDPFFTTKLGQGGTGLGLNIVYNIVTGILGGRIELHSEPGRGSRFVMRLPVKAP